jgi:hypothetical protein
VLQPRLHAPPPTPPELSPSANSATARVVCAISAHGTGRGRQRVTAEEANSRAESTSPSRRSPPRSHSQRTPVGELRPDRARPLDGDATNHIRDDRASESQRRSNREHVPRSGQAAGHASDSAARRGTVSERRREIEANARHAVDRFALCRQRPAPSVGSRAAQDRLVARRGSACRRMRGEDERYTHGQNRGESHEGHGRDHPGKAQRRPIDTVFSNSDGPGRSHQSDAVCPKPVVHLDQGRERVGEPPDASRPIGLVSDHSEQAFPVDERV